MKFLPFLLLFTSLSASAQAVSTPPPGSALRKSLMDAIRTPLEKDLKQPLIFEVHQLRVLGDWAYGDLMPRRKDGSPVDYRKTPYADYVAEGMFDDGLVVLWQRQGGTWRVKTSVLGATDVPYGCWWKAFKAPKAVLPYAEKRCE